MVLRIVSPEKVLYKGEVQMVRLPGTVGQFTILDHHAPLVSTLTAGNWHTGVRVGKKRSISRGELWRYGIITWWYV